MDLVERRVTPSIMTTLILFVGREAKSIDKMSTLIKECGCEDPCHVPIPEPRRAKALKKRAPTISRGLASTISKYWLPPNLLRAGAAADGRVVEADVAAAAAFAALLQAFAALLDHLAAGLVAAGAVDAAAVLGELALAVAASEVDLAAGDAVVGAAAAAEAVAEHLAEVLQRAAGDFIFTAAPDLAAGRGLFAFDRAARQNAPVGVCRRAGRDRARLIARTRERRHGGRTAL